MGPLFPDFLPISFSDTFFYLVKKSIPRHFQDDRQCLSLPGYLVPPRSYSGLESNSGVSSGSKGSGRLARDQESKPGSVMSDGVGPVRFARGLDGQV